MATFFDTLFLKSVPAACRVTLLRVFEALFEEQWAAADGAEVQVIAHDAVNLLGRTTAAWRVEIVKAKASVK